MKQKVQLTDFDSTLWNPIAQRGYCLTLFSTYRPSKDDGSRVEVDFHNIALGDHLNTRNLALSQHFIDKVVPGDVSPTGIDGVKKAHDESNDEECP